MKEIYDNYYKHFARLNDKDKEMFEGVADTYLFWYQKWASIHYKSACLIRQFVPG